MVNLNIMSESVVMNLIFTVTENMDYVQSFETIEIGPSFENETISVVIDIIDDDRAESSETFFIRLIPVGRGVRLESGRDEATVNIIDDDPGNNL